MSMRIVVIKDEEAATLYLARNPAQGAPRVEAMVDDRYHNGAIEADQARRVFWRNRRTKAAHRQALVEVVMVPTPAQKFQGGRPLQVPGIHRVALAGERHREV